MKIYIAGPMSGLPNHNYEAFAEAAKYCRSFDHEVRTPPEINAEAEFVPNPDGSIPPEHYAACFTRDVDAVLWCDTILLLKGWKDSKGAKLEAHLAAVLCKKFIFQDALFGYYPGPAPHFHIMVTG